MNRHADQLGIFDWKEKLSKTIDQLFLENKKINARKKTALTQYTKNSFSRFREFEAREILSWLMLQKKFY